VNPLSAGGLAVLGGWLGTQVFSFVAKYFGGDK
jgi:hypothetical protein